MIPIRGFLDFLSEMTILIFSPVILFKEQRRVGLLVMKPWQLLICLILATRLLDLFYTGTSAYRSTVEEKVIYSRGY